MTEINPSTIAILVSSEELYSLYSNSEYDCYKCESNASLDISDLSTYAYVYIDEEILIKHSLCKELLLTLLNTRTFIFSLSEKNTIEEAVASIKEGFSDYFKLRDPAELVEEIPKRIQRISQISSSNPILKEKDFSERYATIYNLMIQHRFGKKPISDEDIMSIFPGFEEGIEESLKQQFIEKLYTHVFEKETILAIEDESALRQIYEFTFRKSYNILLAPTAEEGLVLAKEHPEVSVILLDVFMPGKNGNEILPDLKALLPASKIYLVTAYKIIDIAVESLQAGAFDYINKPIDHHSLREKVEKALEQYHKDRLKLIETYLEFNSNDFELRIQTLKKLIVERQEKKQSVYYKDIYFLFPEIKEKPVFEQSKVPSSLIDNGIELLVAQCL